MASDAITDKLENQKRPGLAGPELAPSLLREDEPVLPRTLGMIGAALLIFGGMALTFNLVGWPVAVRTGWAIFALAVGLAGLLFHAAFDRDISVRRLYLLFAVVILAFGVVLCLIPYPNSMGDQFRNGVPCLLVALLFLIAFLRNEDEAFVRDVTQRGLLVGGGIMALVGLFGGSIRSDFFLPIGLVYSLLGLLYLVAFVGTRGISDDLAYFIAIGLGGIGLLVILISLGRSFLTADGSTFFVTSGSILLFVGLLYLFIGAGLALDWPLFILTRRELGAFFFSPIAYLTMLGFSVLSWFSYIAFLDNIFDPITPPIEPIVRTYLFALFPVFVVICIVPILTMRLLSEEQRSGTLEVLLTAPVDESTIVLSKFLAALITYLIVWLPFGLYLLAIPLSGGKPFDYRPLLSFSVALIATGASFVSMGVFFSSLTRNQIASGVLTFAGMIALTYIYFAAHQTRDTAWQTVLTHMSYLDLWYNTLEGKIVPRFLLFPLSLTIVFLFMTIKVLESRKWR